MTRIPTTSDLGSLPRIGVSGWDAIGGERSQLYCDRVVEAGLEPVLLSKPGQSMDECAGLILIGGVDVDPSLYGEERGPHTQEPDPGRDAFESVLLAEAMDRDIPTLAICRGFQILNVRLGGGLLQHVEGWGHATKRDEARSSSDHQVRFSGVLSEILGATESVVNSRHHQGVTNDRLAPGLETLAVSSDGLVEAAREKNQRWLIGVQWHPERSESRLRGFDTQSRRLFESFAQAAAV